MDLDSLIHQTALELVAPESLGAQQQLDERARSRAWTPPGKFYIVTSRGKTEAQSKNDALTMAHNASRSQKGYVWVVGKKGEEIAVYKNGKIVEAADGALDDVPLDLISESMDGSRFLQRQYGLSTAQAKKLANHPRQMEILRKLSKWRNKNGLPDTSSPLTRGKLLDLMKEEADVGSIALVEGKAADAILKVLKSQGGGPVALTDLAAHPSMRGMNYGGIERAAKTLVRRGKLKKSENPRDGVMLSLAEEMDGLLGDALSDVLAERKPGAYDNPYAGSMADRKSWKKHKGVSRGKSARSEKKAAARAQRRGKKKEIEKRMRGEDEVLDSTLDDVLHEGKVENALSDYLTAFRWAKDRALERGGINKSSESNKVRDRWRSLVKAAGSEDRARALVRGRKR